MKKLLAIILAAAMAICLTACASPSGGNAEAPEEQIETPKDPTPSAPSSPDPTPSAPSEPSAPDDTTDPDESDTPDDTTDPDPSDDPTEPDPVLPPEEPFSLAENREKIIENIMPLINYYKRHMYGNSATIDNVFDIYLTESDNAEIIDTIGVVFSGTTNVQGHFLEYGTITLLNIQNLSYEYLSQNPQTNPTNLTCEIITIYKFGMAPSNSKYAETIEKIQRKLFDNYDNALWLGWSGMGYPQYDYHIVVCYDGKAIIEKGLTIKNDGFTLPFPNGPVDKYFDKGEYTEAIRETINLPDDTLNALIEKELQEKEQTQGQDQEQAQTPISKETLLPPPAQDRLYASSSHKRAIK